MRRGGRSRRGRDGPAPTSCVQAQCFDPLTRHCVACYLLHMQESRPVPCPPSPSPPPAAGASSLAPGTALQPQESVGAGIPDGALPLPGLLFGAPVLLGLALALALVLLALVSWKRRRRRPGVPSPEARDGDKGESLDDVIVLSLGCPDATAPNSPPPGEEAVTAPPSHSIPVPATELGSTELVTTKTAGPEQQ